MAIEPYIDTMYCELDDQQTAAMLAHIARTWRLGPCRNCEGTFYQLLAQAVLRFNGTPELMFNAQSHERPSAAIVCTTCGELRVLDLTVAGIYERKLPKARATPEPGPRTGPYR